MNSALKHTFLILMLIGLLPAASQCAGQPAVDHSDQPSELNAISPAEGQKLRVIATTSIVADIVSNVGGEAIDLTILLPVGTDPHAFEPAPADLAAVADAHVIFANGMGLEAFLDEMLANAGGEAAMVHVSEGVLPHEMDEAHEEADHEDEHEHDGDDPHTWTSPANALVFVKNIEHALSRLDPANADLYRANAEAYAAELETLDAWVKAQTASIPPENRELVTDHAMFGYYAERYGLEQIGAVIPAFSSAAEPSANDLAALTDAITAAGVKAVFVGNTVNSSLARRVADDTGVQLVQLYTGSLGLPGSGVETYLEYIRYNTTAIVAALK